MNRNSFSLYSGFTLIEVLVVLSLIGILSMPILTYVYNARKEARDHARGATLQQLQLALRLIKDGSATGAYPTGYNAGVELGKGGALDAQILAVFPQLKADPLSAGAGTYGYFYDTQFKCTALNQKVLLARVEDKGNSNFFSVCTAPTGAQQNLPNGWLNGQKNEMFAIIVQ